MQEDSAKEIEPVDDLEGAGLYEWGAGSTVRTRARRLGPALALGLLALLALALFIRRGGLGAIRGSPGIASAILARGATEGFEPIEPTDRFSTSDEIHLIVRARNAPPDTPVRVAWVAAAVEGAAPETTAAEFTQRVRDNQRAEFTFRNQGPWPRGQYRADIYFDGKLVRQIPFEIGDFSPRAGTPSP